MAYRPRRTQAIGESSTSKPTRLSRIAQPIRRPSLRERSLERASSIDQLSNVAFLTASGAKRSRSASATPMRTPNRPIPHSSAVTMTNEKERMPIDDKKFLQAQAARVTDYLHEIGEILGKDFLQRGGLKSMSTKQFITIFSHLLKLISGTRLSISTNYVDDIVVVLGQLEYPYTINKSWLKTPSAPHAFNNVVVLFGWMLDLVPKENCDIEFENEYLIVADDLHDKEYALKFIRSAKIGFSLWNNSKNEEFNNLKKEMIDAYIQIKTNHQTESVEALQTHIRQLTREFADMDYGSNKKCKEELLSLESESNQLEARVKNEEVCLSQSRKVCEENQRSVTRIEVSLEGKQKQIAETQVRIQNIKSAIKTQNMSIKDRSELISQVQHLKQLLDSKKIVVLEIHDQDASNLVLYSRLKKQYIDAITSFNSRLHQIFTDQCDVTDIDFTNLCIDQNSDPPIEEQVEAVIPLLEKVKRSIFQQVKIYTQEISDLEHKHKKAAYEHDTLLEQIRSTLQSCEDYSENVDRLDVKLVGLASCGAKEVKELSDGLSGQIALNVDLRETASSKNEEFVNLRKENEQICTLITEKLQAKMEQKKKYLQDSDAAVKQFWNTLEEVSLKLRDID